MSEIHEIVGAHFRPPAKPLLSSLYGGTAIELRPEPENLYDSNAIAVWLPTSSITSDSADIEALASNLPFFGKTLEEVLEAEAWHLGYIRKEVAAQIVSQFADASLPAKIGFLANGKPAAIFDLPLIDDSTLD